MFDPYPCIYIKFLLHHLQLIKFTQTFPDRINLVILNTRRVTQSVRIIDNTINSHHIPVLQFLHLYKNISFK